MRENAKRTTVLTRAVPDTHARKVPRRVQLHGPVHRRELQGKHLLHEEGNHE
jgi:hypothetical protein